MNVYGIFEEEEEKFENFEMDIFINLQRIASIFKVEIHYQTKFTDVFKSIQGSLKGYGMCMNECDDHHFVYINNRGEEEQLFHTDWNQLVKDLEIFSMKKKLSSELSQLNLDTNYPFHTMKLEQTHGCLDTNRYKLEKMIGIKKDSIIKVFPDEELALFEESSRKLFVNGSKEFSAMSLEEKLLVEHPVQMNFSKTQYQGDININVSLDIPETRVSRNNLNKTVTTHSKRITIQGYNTVPSVIEKILSKFRDRTDLSVKCSDYFLRIAEREEYLVSLQPVEIIRFQHIHICVQISKCPNLLLVYRKQVESMYSQVVKLPKVVQQSENIHTSTNENAFKPGSLKENEFIYIHDLWKQFKRHSCVDLDNGETETKTNKVNFLDDSIDLKLGKVEPTDFLYFVKITKINHPAACVNPVARDQKIIIIAGLYHGEKSLCEHQYREWTPDCDIVFPIEIWNLPRMTRFSFALAIVRKTLEVKDLPNNHQKKFIGWGNVMIYDHKAVLKFDTIQYQLWSSVKPNLNPTGSVYSNPDGILITPLITMKLLPQSDKFKKIVYPPIEILIPEAGKMLGDDLSVTPEKEDNSKIAEILSRSSIDDIMEDEQTILWKYRYYIRDFYQESLPRMLNARPWNNFENVAKMHHLACGWPIDKEVIMALELLGSDFPDCDIRLIAVDSLSRLNWQELSLYQLQICQCMKYESYLNCNLTQMILKKMINNAKLAQSMFYYIKVEISACEWIRGPFSLILYNYLQYSPARCASLIKQYRATNEMCQHNKALMQINTSEPDKKAMALDKFRNSLCTPLSEEVFNDLTCPLDCNVNLKKLNAENCKFMDSKMRPIRLNWCVNTEFLKYYLLIYKNGDDLRQDALIVQILHIMDSIWQRVGLDLKLYPYDVLACSKTEGYIQVVQNAETLANIYKSSKNRNSNLFYVWLKANASCDMKIIVKNFTSSCAAYCVATFILGIGDRHSDNIMITKDGHFFHIDFGHILGNFKRIMGGMVSREWTKFILVQDFLAIITEGDSEKEPEFKELCCKGYLELRKFSNLILSLFKIMVNAGIPEISSMDNLNYLKETLQIGKSEEEAQIYFQKIFDDTRKKEMFVAMNWVAHNIRRDNN